MIQRKQTLFLLLAVILNVLCMSSQVATLFYDSGAAFAKMFNLWLADGQGGHSYVVAPLFVCLMISTLLAIITIFMYMKRKIQAAMCLVNIITLVTWYILMAVMTNFTGGLMRLEWPAVLPAISVILLFMARKGVMADEKLVRSLDRVR